MASVRAKFRCNSVEMYSDKPTEVKHYTGAGYDQKTGVMTWPRTYRFFPSYDPGIPEDQRYARATPTGELRIDVDNPAVTFQPGQQYYLDFTPVEG